MSKNDLKYVHAINILATAKIDALQNMHDFFVGDWEKAWQSDLRKFLPVDLDYQKVKRSIDPDKALARLEKEKIEIITIFDKTFPKPLKHISHPPFLFYIRGVSDVLKENCFGVVGTRALTDYGKRVTPDITKDLVRGGFIIVSGLAAGIDTLAHKTAIESDGKTIAVLGCGVDDRTIFPQQNLKLAHKIIETGGAIISEYAPGTHGSVFTFPQRNRIVSGLSKGVLVVEADIKSGALITARAAIDQNRDLFCVPGNIYSKTSQGTNYMIKEGAKLVTSAMDVLEEYNIYLNEIKKVIKPANALEAKILTVLSNEPVGVNDLVRITGLGISEINVTLVMMELSRKIKNLGNNKFVLYN